MDLDRARPLSLHTLLPSLEGEWVRSVLRVLTTIAFASQLMAMGGSVMVCRYTGEVLKKCCCPQVERTKALESPLSHIIAECCCDQRDSAKADVTATVERSPEKPGAVTLVAVLPPDLPRQLSLEPLTVLEERSIGPPPKTPLYILERHLLI